MRTIIAGGRDYRFTDKDIAFLNEISDQISEVVCGGARGADTEGKYWAEANEIPVKNFPALWDRHGKRAGPIRNEEMAAYSDMLILFPGGKGSADMLRRAKGHHLTIINRQGVTK